MTADGWVGVDVGTSSLKAVLVSVDEDRGFARVERTVSRAYAADGSPTRDPAAWASHAAAALHEVVRGARPLGVGFTGQMHALIPLESGDRVAAPVRLWLDTEGEPALARFVRRHPFDWVARTGNIPLPDFTLAKWLCARERTAGLKERVRRLLLPKDFVRTRVAPGSTVCTDPTDAAGTQVYDPFAGRWDMDIAAAAGIPPEALVDVLPSDAVVGEMRLGECAGVKVVVGAGDQAAAARAVGAVVPGVASLSLGTSGVLLAPLGRADLPPGWSGDLHLFPGVAGSGPQVIATIPALGPGLSWAARLLGATTEELEAWAGAGEGGPCFFPYLGGSGAPHADTERRGVLVGLGLDTDRAAVARAVYEGYALEFGALLDELRAAGVAVREVVLSGGAAELAVFARTVASALGTPVYRVHASSASAAGAALLARDAVRGGGRPVLERSFVNGAKPPLRREAWNRLRARVLAEATPGR